MRVILPAALDALAGAPPCPSRAWLAGAVPAASGRGGRAARATAAEGWPLPAAESALLQACGAAPHGAAEPAAGALAAPWASFPIFAWQTPAGVELHASTLSPRVRSLLAESDEPGALAAADGGWRQPVAVFRPTDGLSRVRLAGKSSIAWADYAALRETLLDLLVDRRAPLLARLAEIAAIQASVAAEQAVPAALPTLQARTFLAFRGHMEARCAAVDAGAIAAVVARAAPLVAGDAGLQRASVEAVCAALGADWRAALSRWVVPAERDLAPAIEAMAGLWLYGAPLARDVSLVRAWAEWIEGLAAGLRLAAAIGAAAGAAPTPLQMVTALALGHYAVVEGATPLPPFELPPATHDRGPRMVDLDMTLASIA